MLNSTAFEQIARYYGVSSQLDMLVEECSELITAVQKVKRGQAYAFDNFVEELADVSIMTQQMLCYMSEEQRKQYNECIDYKLKRQLDRINKEKFDYFAWRKGINT